MEFIDVLDENGNKMGIVKNKSLIYKNGDWHKSVHVWLLNQKKELLIQKRAKDKETFPNLWAISIAGHVMSGETSMEAAIREISEEIGIKIRTDELLHIFSIKRMQPYKDGILKVHDDIYLLKYDLDISLAKLQKEELSDIKFIPYLELENRLKKNDKNFVPYTEEHELLFKYLNDNVYKG